MNDATNYKALPVGTEIYHTGDMANPDGTGVITRSEAGHYWVKMDDGRVINALPAGLFGPPSAGCATRFQVLSERRAWQAKRLEEMRAQLAPRTFKVEYRCDDGSLEFWGEVKAVSEQAAVAEAKRQEPVCIDGRPLRFVATAL